VPDTEHQLFHHLTGTGIVAEALSVRTQNLRKVLYSKYLPLDEFVKTVKADQLVKGLHRVEVEDVYRQLGGQGNWKDLTVPAFPLRFLKFSAVLDEHRQFNHYRLRTLRSTFYERTAYFPLEKYRHYCSKYESECLKAGVNRTYWTNPLSEQHFGASQLPGDLGLSGSSGWKLQAFLDFLQDVYAFQKKERLLRLSVWDEVMVEKQLMRLNEMLLHPDKRDAHVLLQYLERRVFGLYA
jgi:hypothetical protein